VTAVQASVDLAVPVDEAWAAVTDWVGQGQWIPMTRVAVTDGDGSFGTRLSARTGIGRLAFVDTMVVDQWDPPRRCEVAHLGRVVRGRGVFTVEPTPAGSRVTWIEQLEGLAARLAAPVSRLALQVALRRLARVVVQ
jgi:carbon monoxide dehydrogenase subunit G